MSILFTINDQAYSAPNKVTIGRGEPFSVFGKSFSVSRAHVALMLKNKKIYIKDLGSKIGTRKNGTRITSKQWIVITPEDSIEIDNYVLRIVFKHETKQVIKIKSEPIQTPEQVLKLILVLFTIGLTVFLNDVPQGTKITQYHITEFLFDLVVIAVICVSLYWLIIYLRFTHLKKPKEVLFSLEGFTVHFEDGTNRTFALGSIDNWNKIFDMLIIRVGIKEFIIPGLGGSQEIINFLKKNDATRGEFNRKTDINFFLLTLVIKVLLITFVVIFMGHDVAKTYAIKKNFALALAALGIGSILSHKFFGFVFGWIIQSDEKRKQFILAGTLAILASGFWWLSDQQLNGYQSSQALLTKCITGGQPIACEHVKTELLIKHDVSFTPEQLEMLCKNGNSEACSRQKSSVKLPQ